MQDCCWKLRSSDYIGELIHSLYLCPCGNFVHVIIESLLVREDFCLALTWNISMLTHYIVKPLPQIYCWHFSNSVLSNSWLSSQTLSHCTWIRVDPNCWSFCPVKMGNQMTAQRFAFGEDFTLSRSFKNTFDQGCNTTAVHFRLGSAHCAKQL